MDQNGVEGQGEAAIEYFFFFFTLKPFCSANWMMVSRLSLVVFVASKTCCDVDRV